MEVVAYSTARKHFVETMERVCDDHEPLIVTRKNSRSVVIMSLDDYNSIQETAYLLRSPANATNLRASIKQYKTGKHKARKLIEK